MWIKKLLTKINLVLEKTEEVGLLLGTIALAVILIVNVIARKIGMSIYFIDEMASLLLIWITFIGASYATRKGRHIRMSAIFDMCSKRVQKILIFVSSIISMATMFIAMYISFKYLLRIYYFNQITPALRMPYWIGITIVPFGFFMAGIHYLRTIVKNIQVRDEIWVSPEQKSEYDDIGGI